jgi:hypothetical protein
MRRERAVVRVVTGTLTDVTYIPPAVATLYTTIVARIAAAKLAPDVRAAGAPTAGQAYIEGYNLAICKSVVQPLPRRERGYPQRHFAERGDEAAT